jgi:hypothetical protein
MKKLLLLLTVTFITLTLSLTAYAQKGKKATVAKKSVIASKGTLSIEAGIIFKNGDVKPVARTDFYLLDDDLETIIKNLGVEEKVLKGRDLPTLTQLAFWKQYQNLYQDTFSKAMEAIEKHSVSKMTSDFSGKGEFPPVKIGKYWLVGIGGTANQVIIWNLPIEIKTGKQPIVLDNKNSSAII